MRLPRRCASRNDYISWPFTIDGNLYIGYTTDLRKRFQDHQNGKVPSTKSRIPFELVFYEGYKAMADAKRREKYLKTSKGKSSLRLILRNSLK